jgi:hypothetical protein
MGNAPHSNASVALSKRRSPIFQPPKSAFVCYARGIGRILMGALLESVFLELSINGIADDRESRCLSL